MATYRIKDWVKFQHFKDRRPLWIKLYKDILDDPEWHELDPVAAKHLVMFWLIAAESETPGTLPGIRRLAFRMRETEKRVFDSLSKLSHWVEIDDITPISSRYQLDIPEKRREEKRRDREETEKRREETDLRSAPEGPAHASPVTKQKTQIQEVVEGWKTLTGFDPDDKAWDKAHFARCSRSAKQLLDFLGSPEKAIECMRWVHGDLTQKGLTVTLETVAKHSDRFKAGPRRQVSLVPDAREVLKSRGEA